MNGAIMPSYSSRDSSSARWIGLPVSLGKVFLLDAGEGMIRKVFLGRLGRAQDPRHRLGLVRDVHALLDLQVLEDVLDDLVVEIVAAEMVVAMARYDLDDALFDPHDRHVKGSAAEIIDQDALALMLRRLVDQGRRCRLIDDANDLQPGNLARLARCLTLRVGEIGRHRDDRLAHRPPEALFGDFLEAFQNDGRDFLWCILASGEMDFVIAAHLALDRADVRSGYRTNWLRASSPTSSSPVSPTPDHRGQDYRVP